MSWNGRLSQKLYLLAFNAEPSAWLTTLPHGQKLRGTSLIHSGIAGVLPSVPLKKKSVLPMDGNLDASFCRGRARWPSQPSCKPSALSALKLGNHGFVCHHPNVLCTTFDLSEPMRLVAWRFSHLLHQQFEVYWRKIRSSVRHETGGWPWMHFVMAQQRAGNHFFFFILVTWWVIFLLVQFLSRFSCPPQ